MKNQDIFLTQENFDADLEICLTILSYPSKQHPYYVCEYISAALEKKTVNIHIIK